MEPDTQLRMAQKKGKVSNCFRQESCLFNGKDRRGIGKFGRTGLKLTDFWPFKTGQVASLNRIDGGPSSLLQRKL